MSLDDRLTADQKRIRKKAEEDSLYYAEEPDWLIYEERKAQPWLNKNEGVFKHTDKASLNKAPSVFEAGTLFDTRKDTRQT